MRLTTALLIVFALMLSGGLSQARVIYVPDEFDSIQGAMLDASSGDSVFVAPGIYSENVNFLGKNVLLKSLEGPEVTTIDGSYPDHPDSASCVMFVSFENRDAILDGFRLTNGGGVSRGDWGFYGGGVYVEFASPTIRNNIMTGNMGDPSRTPDDTSGGGIYCFYGNPLIEHNVIFGHNVSYIGGGIGISFCRADIVNNTIFGNSAEWGGGISFWRYSQFTIQNNIIVGNTGGGGIWCGAEIPDIRFNDVWNNAGGDYWECYPGTGDISEDPLFVDQGFDFHLLPDSPCIDAGDPNSPLDPDGTRADMGAFYFHQGAVPAIDISVVPDTTVVKRGTYLGFTVHTVNTTGELLTFQGWTEGVTPWGTPYSPLLGPINVALGPHAEVSAHFDQPIPNQAPFGGPYIYRVLVGTYPDETIDSDEFEFFVVP
jgi:hypothetical protein